MKPLKIIRSIVLFVCIATLPSLATADLSWEEDELRHRWLTQPDVRNQTVDAYWNDVVKASVAEVQHTLPVAIGKYVYLTNVYYDGDTMVTYTYVSSIPYIQPGPMLSDIKDILCNSEQSILFLEVFEGTVRYVHKLRDKPYAAPVVFIITAADCRDITII